MEHLRTVRGIAAGVAAMLVAASLTGCMEFMDMASLDASPSTERPASHDAPPSGASQRRAETTSATVRVAGPLTIASAKGDHADIDSVTVSVAGQDSQGTHQDPLATATLTETDGVWNGTLSGLTVGTELTFSAQALDSSSTVIFTGTHTATLDSVGAQVTIRLSAVDDGESSRFPKVTGISISNVSTGVATGVSITVTGSGTEDLSYEFSGTTFDPSTGTVTLSGGTGTITATYTPPVVVGWYTEQISVQNAQGHRVEVDFQIRVQTSSLTARLGPVVQGITGKRTPAGVRWTARVSAAGDGLTYAWTFTGNDASFTDSSANPTILTGYGQATTGTLKITVTDTVGLTTSASLVVAVGLFPNLDQSLMPAAAALVVNEIDYDQAGSTDAAEFVEILNPGSSAVDLSAYRIELVDGADDEPYLTYEPSGQLAAGGFLVIADQAVIADNSLPDSSLPLTGSGITNGPDGVRIVTRADGRVVDAVHYERVVPGSGEGSAAPHDPADPSTSIGRCPNGFDSDDNGLDFRVMTATPGAANTCS